MSAIITATGVGKTYQIGAKSTNSLREALARLARRRSATTNFDALDDVSFEIQPGEAVGIIGRNGAGKSTLLKILSRITAPSRGEIRLRGRVAALLEVGTGFHSELTGRENIFLNGAIMGMSRAEVRRSFDDIVAFAEVDKFLDTPVKRYSSGMYVRLAFAVAAHLRPEILVVDEVLAVGDAAFQKKCLGKMQDVASGGRTVLFVSHNMAAITRLCSRAILLRDGKVVADDRVDKAVSAYLRGTDNSPVQIDYEATGRMPGDQHARLLAARVVAKDMTSALVSIDEPVVIEVDYEVLDARKPMHAAVRLFNEEGACVFVSNDSYDPSTRSPREPGRYRAAVEIPANFLAEGMFSVGISLASHVPVHVHFYDPSALAFQVNDPADGLTTRGTSAGPLPGVTRPLLPWRTRALSSPKDEQA